MKQILADEYRRATFGEASNAQEAIDRIEVRWPNGNVEIWTGVEPNRIVTLTEGTGRPLPAKTGGK